MKSQQHAATLEALRSYSRQHILPGAGERDRKEEFAHPIYETVYELGLIDASLPKSLGGAGWETADVCRAFMELGYASAGVCSTVTGIMLGSFAIAGYASEEVKQKVFANTRDKRPLFSLAMTEAAVGFDVGSIQTVARVENDAFVISGRKSYVSNATHAAHFAVFAQTISADGTPLGISCFYIPRDQPGLEPGRIYTKLGHREANTAELELRNVRVPQSHLLGQVGGGLKILTRCLGRTKAFLAASALGTMDRALDLARAHLNSRRKGDKSLFDKPAIQHAMVRLLAERAAVALVIEKAGSEWDAEAPTHPYSNVAKLLATDLAVRACSEAIEWIGASGYVDEHEIARLYRDVKLFEIYEGSTLVLETQLIHEWFPKAKPAALRKAA